MTTTHKVDLENINPPRHWQKDMFLAYVLWFFLGMFGAHNFYTERQGIAIAQLLLTVTIIFVWVNFVWVIVDAFLIPGRVRQPPYGYQPPPVQNVHITIQNSGESDKEQQ